ncbi:MAG: bifunctional folylpolyglutamate synthase/dihydrofolate synthase [Clostridiales bacterium]|nr:bifunctional folylpolyglutamate synthase/dihydrofolate synthase [Clostridiales bacterium]
MNYTESVEYIHSLLRFGIKPGLERISELLKLLGNPQEKVKTVHIAGTNGKGSTSTMTANILKNAGYKTGLFTSPYVINFRERIRINGEMIPEDVLSKTVCRVKEKIDVLNADGIEITEFEAITAAAYLYFAEEECGFAVMETGLGGRFDATNVITKPALCIITSISFDHTDILGDSLEKIAFEKCGIIKEGCPVITSQNQSVDAMQVIEKTCEGKSSPLLITNPQKAAVISDTLGKTVFGYMGEDYELRLNGMHQIENAVNAIEAAKVLGISKESVKRGLCETVMTARMEVISHNPLIIREGGHNAGCALALKEYIERYDICHIHMLIGMMADKDTDYYLKTLAPLCERITCVTVSNPRAIKAEELAAIAEKYCKNVSYEENPKKAYIEESLSLSDDDTLLVCGSFYLMSDIFTA